MSDFLLGVPHHRYERRLLVEVDRFNRLEADKEDGQYAMEERLHTLDQAHKKVC